MKSIKITQKFKFIAFFQTFTFSLAMALGFGLVAGLNLNSDMEETKQQVLFINNLSRNTARQGMYSL